MRTFLIGTLCVIAVFAEDRDLLVKRQVAYYTGNALPYGYYRAPLYSPCGPALPPCAPPAVCQASMCIAPAPPQFAPPSPPPPPPPPAPVYSPPVCQPACAGAAPCIQGVCTCPAPIVYNPVIGCAPPPPPPPPPPAGRLIPQALPGAPCEPGVECTGGSVCSMGICLCPPELVQEGTVCVSRTIYGPVVPVMPAPAPIPVPVPAPAYLPPPPPPPVVYQPPPPPPAIACQPACVGAAPCIGGVCTCPAPAMYSPIAGCVRRKMARHEPTNETLVEADE